MPVLAQAMTRGGADVAVNLGVLTPSRAHQVHFTRSASYLSKARHIYLTRHISGRRKVHFSFDGAQAFYDLRSSRIIASGLGPSVREAGTIRERAVDSLGVEPRGWPLRHSSKARYILISTDGMQRQREVHVCFQFSPVTSSFDAAMHAHQDRKE